jgi:hypothetical protein
VASPLGLLGQVLPFRGPSRGGPLVLG